MNAALVVSGPMNVVDNDDAIVAHAREVLAKHARSFRFAGMFLPAGALNDAAVVYAFCRVVDDEIDEAPDLHTAQQRAAALGAELRGEAPARREVAAFVVVARRLKLDLRFAECLVQGVDEDAVGHVRLADDAALVRYGYLVAGTVGGMMCAVLGVKDAAAWPFAVDLGVGMQITNICRDVLEDAHKDRIYVPLERLRAQGVNVDTFVDDVMAGRGNRQAVAAVVTSLLALADRYYASADLGMRAIPWRSRFAIVVASRVYRAIGTMLLRRGGDALAGRVSTTTAQKVWLATKAVFSFVRVSLLAPRAHERALHEPLRGLPGTSVG